MKQFFRDYFTFNKSERNGILILVLIIIALLFYLNISHLFIKSNETINFTDFENEIQHFRQHKISNFDTLLLEENNQYSLFNFDPNNTSDNNWSLLGFSDKQIKSINNYLKKGGEIRKKRVFRSQ